MEKYLKTPQETAQLILSGRKLLLAGNEDLLSKLPQGEWIAGTSPYFMDIDGGQVCQDKIFVNDITDFQEEISIKVYTEDTIKNIYKDGFDNGFTALIIPPYSNVHTEFAVHAPDYENFATRPLMGWVSCYSFPQDNKSSKTFFKTGDSGSTTNAVAMHVKLPKNKYAEMDLINLYTQGNGDEIIFLEDGFNAKDVLINGEKQNFAEYIRKKHIDTTLPIVANYNSAMINVSIESLSTNQVNLVAPVFKDVKYRFAKSIENLESDFQKFTVKNNVNPVCASICILLYYYAKLEGKQCGNIYAPITNGEICYQLVNQTVVTLEIKDV